MNNLKAIMEERSLTCKRLSEISGVAPNTIKKFRRDDEAITRAYKATVQQLADALHVTPAVLAGTERYEKGNSYLLWKRLHDSGIGLLDILRDFSDEPLEASISVSTRDEDKDHLLLTVSKVGDDKRECYEQVRVKRDKEGNIIGIVPEGTSGVIAG